MSRQLHILFKSAAQVLNKNYFRMFSAPSYFLFGSDRSGRVNGVLLVLWMQYWIRRTVVHTGARYLLYSSCIALSLERVEKQRVERRFSPITTG